MKKEPRLKEIHRLHRKITKWYGKINRLTADVATCSTNLEIARLEQRVLLAHVRISQLRLLLDEVKDE